MLWPLPAQKGPACLLGQVTWTCLAENPSMKARCLSMRALRGLGGDAVIPFFYPSISRDRDSPSWLFESTVAAPSFDEHSLPTDSTSSPPQHRVNASSSFSLKAIPLMPPAGGCTATESIGWPPPPSSRCRSCLLSAAAPTGHAICPGRDEADGPPRSARLVAADCRP